MTANGQETKGFGDPFTGFWTDMMTRMAAAGVQPPGAATETTEKMRHAFFTVLSEHAEQFMRSEEFLNSLKQSLDNALVFKQQLNQFFQKNLQFAQMPTSNDADHLALLVRGMEDRVMDKLSELSTRIDRLEHRNGRAPSQARSRTTASKKSAAGSKRAKKSKKTSKRAKAGRGRR